MGKTFSELAFFVVCATLTYDAFMRVTYKIYNRKKIVRS